MRTKTGNKKTTKQKERGREMERKNQLNFHMLNSTVNICYPLLLLLVVLLVLVLVVIIIISILISTVKTIIVRVSIYSVFFYNIFKKTKNEKKGTKGLFKEVITFLIFF